MSETPIGMPDEPIRSGSHFRLSVIAGILVIMPLWLTGWLLLRLVLIFDGIFDVLPKAWQPEMLVGHELPGLGIVLSLLFVYLCGVGTRLYAGRRLVALYEGLLERVPIISGIYSALKQLLSTFFSEQSKNFQEVVLVEYPRKGMYCFAFLTNIDPYMNVNNQQLVSIFLPSTPNPTTGFYLLVPIEDVLDVDLTVEEAFRLIMSAGIVSPNIVRSAVPLSQTFASKVGQTLSKPRLAMETKESPPITM